MSAIILSPLDFAAVFVGGGSGACCRYGVGRFIALRYRGTFPLATFGINVTGSALLGFLMGLPLLHGYGSLALLLETGGLGGYTTFSTAALETTLLLRDGNLLLALRVWLGGTALGLAGAALGFALAAMFWPGWAW